MARFDFKTLTLGEVAQIEKLSGLSIAAIEDDEAPKGNALAAVAMIIKRRELRAANEPAGAFTWAHALDLTLDEATALIYPADEEEDPVEQPPLSEEDVNPTPGERHPRKD